MAHDNPTPSSSGTGPRPYAPGEAPVWTPPKPTTGSSATQQQTGDNPYMVDANGNQLKAGQASQGTSTVPWNSNTDPVVVGYSATDAVPYLPGHTPNVTTVYDATKYLSYWRRNDPTTYAQVISWLRQSNYLGARSNSIGAITEAWKTALEDSATAYANDPTANSDVMAWLASGHAGPGGSTGGSGGAYTGPTSQVTLSSEFDARAIVDQAYNQWLGRDATPKEREQFWHRLNAQQRANPNVATPQGHNVVQSGGFNAQQFAEDTAKADPLFAETQASTTLMDWVAESLGDKTKVA